MTTSQIGPEDLAAIRAHYADEEKHADVHALCDALAWVWAGADSTPVPQEAAPSAAQVWHLLLRSGPEVRLRRLGHLQNLASSGNDCWLRNHDGELDSLRREAAALRRERAVLRVVDGAE